MDIFINGDPGVASTDDDVTIGELFQYLRAQFAQQQCVVRSFVLDGNEIDEADAEIGDKSPSEFKKLEVQVGTIEVVAYDVVTDLLEKMPILVDEAVKITELIQTGNPREANERLLKLYNSIFYITDALVPVTRIIPVDQKTFGEEEKSFHDVMQGMAEQLQQLKIAVDQQDHATVGDILEFDIAPTLTLVGEVMKGMQGDLAKLLKEREDEAGND